MILSKEKYDATTVLTIVPGTLELKNVPEFKLEMEEHIAQNRNIILDMQNIGFIDSTGCGALLACKKQMDKKGDGSKIKLCTVSKPVMATFRLIRFNRILHILETRREALDAFQDQPEA